MQPAIFQARDWCVFYGAQQVLFDINLSIAPRQVTSVIGPSGCGKSSFLRSLNRMNDEIAIYRHTGHLLLENEDIYAERTNVAALRARVGMVFQKPNPFPKSIFDNVVYGPKIHDLARGREALQALVEAHLRRVNLWDEVKDRLHHSAGTLSGGQQQRLCIARVLAVSPDVILMDEPCSALDPIATGHIEELMTELARSVTIVIVTHSMQQAARVSEDTAFFNLGKLIESGKTKDVFTNPRHKLTEDYITGRIG